MNANLLARISLVLAAAILVPACGDDDDGGVAPPAFSGFDANGNIVVNPDPGEFDEFEDAVIDSTNGHFLVAGIVGNGVTTNMMWRIEKRLLSDGSLVAAFGIGGVLEIDPNPGATGLETAVGLAIDAAADELYIAGWEYLGSGNTDWRVEKRVLSDGSADGVFGGGAGFVNSGFTTGDNRPAAIAIDATSMYVVGHRDLGSNKEWRIEKRDRTSGNLETGTFGPSLTGVQNSNVSAEDDEPRDLAIDIAGGDMYVVGIAGTGSNDAQWHIEKRSLTTGALVDFGALSIDHGAGDDDLRSIALDAAGGSMYLAGDDSSNGGFDVQWHVQKRDIVSGILDGTFNSGAGLPIDFGPGFDLCFGIALDGTDLYVSGMSHDVASPSALNFRVEIQRRDAGTGALDGTFGVGGTLTEDPTPLADAMVVFGADTTDIYLGGLQNIDMQSGGTDVGWRIEKRLK